MRPLELRSPRVAGILALSLGLSACASGSGGSAGGGGSADVITEQQIDDAGANNALEVVQRYRSRWLRPARNSSGAIAPTSRPGMPQKAGDAVATHVYPKVFLDGAPYGEIDALSSINSGRVASIQFVRAADATIRYGGDYVGGVIEVRTRAGK